MKLKMMRQYCFLTSMVSLSLSVVMLQNIKNRTVSSCKQSIVPGVKRVLTTVVV